MAVGSESMGRGGERERKGASRRYEERGLMETGGG